MSIPNFQETMLPVLQAVSEGEIHVKDLVDKISNYFNLSEEQREEKIPSDSMSTIASRTQWAATYLVKAGLLSRPKRGYLLITEEGLSELSNRPSKIDIKYLDKFKSFQEFRKKTNTENDDQIEQVEIEEKTPEDAIDSASKVFEQSVKSEILEMILSSSPQFFEKLIIQLFQAMGYGGLGQSTHVGRTGDGGIDGVINEDPLGLEKIYLQAKRYAPQNKIAIDQIRSFAGSLDERKARKGIFVTTSKFVDNAFLYAQNSPKSLILIDGDELTRLMYEYDVGVRTVQTIKLKKPDLDYFEEI